MITVYLYYLKLSDDFLHKLSTEERQGFQYVQSSFKHLPSKKYDDCIIYLYAYTKKKKHAKKFESLHNMTLFTRYKVEMMEDEFSKFKSVNNYAEFGKQKVEDYYPGEDGIIWGTVMETYDLYSTAETYALDRLYDFSVVPVKCFKDEYVEALDRLRFSYYYEIQSSDDPDAVYDNDSYGISSYGYGKALELYPDTYICFLELFRPILRKELIRREDLEVL